MNKKAALLLIKLAHTLIWAFFVSIILYILYCGLTDKVNKYTGLAVGLVVLEGLTLWLFNRHCPLTLLARKYSASTQANFDIFLPNWLAHYNQLIFTTIYVAGLAVVGYRLLF